MSVGVEPPEAGDAVQESTPGLSRVPVVALVGRPNVGKSTLFNRLVGRRIALVHDQPGVTRDRLVGDAELNGRLVHVVDTGGLDTGSADPVLGAMRHQTQLAIETADLVLLVLDARQGVQAADRDVVDLLRRAGKTILVVGNKVDTAAIEPDLVPELYALGCEPVLAVSAEHGRGFGELVDALLERIEAPAVESVQQAAGPVAVQPDEPEAGTASRIEWQGGPIRVAVIGRPNVGKSSLINRLLGEPRLLATEVAGTTRDAVDIRIMHQAQPLIFVDTAGLRRKSQVTDTVERFAVLKALRSLEQADVALLVLDGAARPSGQDAKIAALAHERGKGIVLVANKWDLVENPEWRERFPQAVRVDLPVVDYATLLLVSAKTGRGTHKLLDAVVAAQRERHRRVSTAELNRFVEAVVAHNPPALYRGKRAKLYYCSQPLVRPPTFIFTAARPDHIPTTYARYLRNALRERYGFEGTPIWLKFRPRGKSARGSHKGARVHKLTR